MGGELLVFPVGLGVLFVVGGGWVGLWVVWGNEVGLVCPLRLGWTSLGAVCVGSVW